LSCTEQIYTLKQVGHNQRQIAELLGRSASTISRELKRNTGLKGYRPKQADCLAKERRQLAYKASKLTDNVLAWIVQLIRQDLSPQQVVDYLRLRRNLNLHHETIYQLIYADKCVGGDLYKHLRLASKPYRKGYGHYDRRGKIKNRVSIDGCPGVVERRCRLGDWEGDTLVGKGRQSALLTLVERKTLYTVIVRLKSKRADVLANKLVKRLSALKGKVKTITFDNGLH
jgi:IS30 family transposase